MRKDDSDERDSTENLNGYPLHWNENLRPDDVDEAIESNEDE